MCFNTILIPTVQLLQETKIYVFLWVNYLVSEVSAQEYAGHASRAGGPGAPGYGSALRMLLGIGEPSQGREEWWQTAVVAMQVFFPFSLGNKCLSEVCQITVPLKEEWGIILLAQVCPWSQVPGFSMCLFGISVSKLICYCAVPGTDAKMGTSLLKTISLKI